AIEKLGVASSSCLERELLHSVGRIRRRVSQNIQDLLLPGDLKETRVFRGVELYISGIAFIRHASLVFDVQLQALTGGGNEYPVLRKAAADNSATCEFTGGNRPPLQLLPTRAFAGSCISSRFRRFVGWRDQSS